MVRTLPQTRNDPRMSNADDHPWSPINFLDFPPAQLKQAAWEYRTKPNSARCPVHRRSGRSEPCKNCRQVRLYAQDLLDKAKGLASEERSRKRHEIAACRLCDSSGMVGFRLPNGDPAAARCQHSEGWLTEAVADAAESFWARKQEDQARQSQAASAEVRQAVMNQLRTQKRNAKRSPKGLR